MKRTRRAAMSASPPTWSCTTPSASTERPLMVKSRRSASRTQSRPNATLALRPKVSVSSRSVVTSNGWPVDDQRHRAVLDAGRHALDAARPWRGGSLRRAAPWSRYRCRRAECSSSALRTAPPTTRASSPSPLSSASTRAAGPDVSHGASASTRASFIFAPGLPGHELAVLDMGGNIGRVRRRAGKMRQQEEADDDQQQRTQHELGDQMQRPGGLRRTRRSGLRPETAA